MKFVKVNGTFSPFQSIQIVLQGTNQCIKMNCLTKLKSSKSGFDGIFLVVKMKYEFEKQKAEESNRLLGHFRAMRNQMLWAISKTF